MGRTAEPRDNARGAKNDGWNADVTPEGVEEMRRRAAKDIDSQEWDIADRAEGRRRP